MSKRMLIGKGKSSDKYHNKKRPKQKAQFKAKSLEGRITISFRKMSSFAVYLNIYPDLKLITE